MRWSPCPDRPTMRGQTRSGAVAIHLPVSSIVRRVPHPWDSQSLRTLLFTTRLPWPIRGGHDLRIGNIAQVLARHGPTFMLALAGDPAPPPPPWDGLVGAHATNDPSTTRPLRGRRVGEWVRDGGSPFAGRYSAEVAEELTRVIQWFGPDLIIAGPLEIASYIPLLREIPVHLVLEADQSEFDLLSGIARQEEGRPQALVRRLVAERAGEVETETMKLVDQAWVASDLEAAGMRARFPQGPDVAVVPNVVNTDLYPLAGRRNVGALVYPALFGFRPNDLAAKELVSEVIPQLPSMTLTLVGGGIADWLRDLDQPRVEVTGPVPDVVPYLTRSWAMPIPLRAGGGTRLKVLEGLAVGLPIVSTGKGVEGLDLRPEHEFLIAESPREFCTQLERLRDDPSVAAALVQNGRATVREQFSLTAAAEAVESAIDRLAAPTRS
jgi:glycosyltransferase involved in cell wall biosynthesis